MGGNHGWTRMYTDGMMDFLGISAPLRLCGRMDRGRGDEENEEGRISRRGAEVRSGKLRWGTDFDGGGDTT